MKGFLQKEPVMQYSGELHLKLTQLGLELPTIDWNLSEHPYTTIMAYEPTAGRLVRAIVKVQHVDDLTNPALHDVVVARIEHNRRKHRFFDYPENHGDIDKLYYEKPPTDEELRK